MTGRRFVVSGRVQGVGFRWFVRQRARALDLRGFVRNCPDGTVEVVAEGSGRALSALEEQLRAGPRLAMVDRVVPSDLAVPDRRFVSFEILGG